MTTTIMSKEDFIQQTYDVEIQSILDNAEWNDTLQYYWPTFSTWLDMHEISNDDKQLIADYYEPYMDIKTKHAGGYYTVSDDQFVMMVSQEQECSMGDWYDKEEQARLKEECTMADGDEYFYIYNPTAFYFTIEDILSWLKEQKENN